MGNGSSLLTHIAFDADDTLWHNETFYQASISQFKHILAPYASEEEIQQHLDGVEMLNIPYFGYGIKAFVLSMIETAVEISNQTIPPGAIKEIIQLGRGMLSAEMTPLPGVVDTLKALSARYPLMLITKGDLMDQEAKLERSGLASYFQHIEIVSEKTQETYQKILNRNHIDPEAFMMVGNSLKSDILPVVQIGARAVYVPHELTWSHELQVDGSLDDHHFFEIDTIDQLPALIEHIEAEAR